MRAFVSATFIDLMSYRKIAQETLMSLGIEAIMMEYIGPTPDEPTKACLKEIKESDIFIGIYAHRYGYIPNGESKSVIHIEFEYAKEQGKPLFCYIVDNEYPWLPEMIEDDPGRSKLRLLKENIRRDLLIRTFKDPENLGRLMAGSLGKWLQDPEIRKLYNLIIPVHSKTLIAVFGKRLINSTITREGLSRIIKLVDYLKKAIDKEEDIIITFTGGLFEEYGVSESETFLSTYYRYLYERQSDFPQIISYPVRLDLKSTNTVENVHNIIELLKKEGSLKPGTNLVVKLCSSGYHLDRLMKIHDLIPPRSILSIFDTDEFLEKTKISVRLADRSEHLSATQDIFTKPQGELYTTIDRLTLFRVYMEWIIDLSYNKKNELLTRTIEMKDPKISIEIENEVEQYIEDCINSLNRQKKIDICEKIYNDTKLCFRKIDDLLSLGKFNNIPVETIRGVLNTMKNVVERVQYTYKNIFNEYKLFDRLLTDINRIVDPDEKLDIDAARLEL